MKYFAVEQKDKEDLLFTSITSLRQYLKEHVEIAKVYRYWWSGSDLVECTPYRRDEILINKARILKSGETAQWAIAHGRL